MDASHDVFDEVVETRTRVIIYTSDYTLRGDISLFPGARLTDYMNSGSDFVVLTDAHVAAPDGRTILRSAFLNLRQEHIVFIVEDSALVSD